MEGGRCDQVAQSIQRAPESSACSQTDADVPKNGMASPYLRVFSVMQ